MCEHLQKAEKYIEEKGLTAVFRGRPWGKNCREWVYFDCILDTEQLITKLALDPCVKTHNYQDIKIADELGLFCTLCKDGIMGVNPQGKMTNKLIIN